VRFSVVIPTYRRRERVLRHVAALAEQSFEDFEVVVVDDGSGDGTADALRALETPFPLTVVEQENQGAAQARNVGARAAAGELLLFLDDDMEADPELLAEHERSHRDGADLVVGDMPLHPASPPGLLSWGVGVWAQTRRERLTGSGAEPGLDDLLTGQMSISREAFEQLGGFDTSFTREGLFGGEDIDFSYRVVKAGLKAAYNPAAVSYQYYAVDPAAYLRRSRETGRSEEELVLKHPEQADRLAAAPDFHTRRSRWLLGPLVKAPDWAGWPLRKLAIALARSGRRDLYTRRLFFGMRTVEHRRGSWLARRSAATGSAIVLAFHAVSDLGDDPVLAEYGVPPRRFAEHLDALVGRGWNFVDLDTLLAALDGRAELPERALLVSFDDCYLDLLSEAAPLLAARSIPAVAYAVAGLTGGANEWDRPLGARELRLLDAEGLRALAAAGIEVGSHGMNHRQLTKLPPAEAAAEIRDSAAALEALGLPRPRTFSYPHGERNPEIEAAVRESGYRAAFTVTAGRVERGSDRYALPRIEVLASDTRWRLRLKLTTAAWPPALRRRILRLTRTRE
jgi:GT2 family glycosyltransferase/peptidoglycan/xylan/chitin deacetylase (PgdA/CDA1 family)